MDYLSEISVLGLFLAVILQNVHSYISGPTGSSNNGQDVLGYHSDTYDVANVTVHNDLDEAVQFYLQSSECYQCRLLHIVTVKPHEDESLMIDTALPVTYAISDFIKDNMWPDDNKILCQNQSHFGEDGSYSITVDYKNFSNEDYYCGYMVTSPPHNSALPIYIAIAVYTGVAILYCISIHINWSRSLDKVLHCFSTRRLISNDLGSPDSSVNITGENANSHTKKVRSTRLKSLDTFRGIAIVIMIFVNYGAGKYWFFVHSKWNGLTLADLAFPWFIFIMGASIKLSQSVLFSRGVTKWFLFKKIIRRSIILFGLGLLLDGGSNLEYYRVPGVLQRFAISYGVVATIQLISLKHYSETRIRGKFYQFFCDILDYWYEWIFILFLLGAYLCTVFLWLPPGCPTRGYLGPGGPLVQGNYTNCTGGAHGAIDRLIFGPNHIYQRPGCQKIYRTIQPYDPEGLLGYLTSIVLTYFGLQASKIFHTYHSHLSRLARLITWGFLLGGIGTLLCEASRDEGWIPINKNLWSPSFILVTAGLAYLCLSGCYFLVDVKGWWSGTPFIYPGMNSILIYVGHELLHNYFPFSWSPLYATHAEYLLMSLVGASLWVAISIWLFYIPFFLKI